MKRIFFVILLYLFPLMIYSQSEKEQKADKYYHQYSFDKAIDQYTEINHLSADGLRNLAESYLNRDMFDKAAEAYAKIVNTPSATVKDYYNYILVLKATGKYADTRKWYEKIKEKNPKDLRVASYFDTEDKFQSLLTASDKYKISNLKINTDAEDFGTAFYTKNQITFTSSRKSFSFIRRNYNWNEKPFLDIYVADADKNHELGNIHYWNKKINKKWHQGPVCFARNGTLAAFTRNFDAVSNDGEVRLQLFFSSYQNNQWTEPEPFSLNNPAYSVGHPCLTADGNTMYFASNMPGGFGGSDIYVVTKDPASGLWGKPTNLGSKINTEANELFPFFDEKSGLLFFSSNGLNGLGGLDVYVAEKTPDGFTNVKNLGAPVNTPFDDFAYIIAENHKYGYLSSNRPGGKGDDDVYKFTFSGEFKSYVSIVTKNTIRLVTPDREDAFKGFTYRIFVLNKDSHRPILKADVRLGSLAQLTDAEGLVSHTYVTPIDYNVSVNAVGYKPKQLKVTVPNFRNGYVLTDTVLLEANMNQKIVLKNIYYDYDRANILPESSVELDKVVTFLKDNPKLQVELSSHTDSRGSDGYNMRLSEARAQSAVKYIVAKGIEQARITAKGYGETQLINGCANGVPCTEEQHRQNRRTEIFISGYGKALNVKQTKGKQ